MKPLYGKPLADEILDRLKNTIALGKEKPGLAVILVGDDKASQVYVSLKEKKARAVGMDFFRFDLPADAPENEVLDLVGKLNGDAKVHGIIVQLPLPPGLPAEKIIGAIEARKDADGFHPRNIKNFSEGRPGVRPVFPRANLLLAQSAGQDLTGKKALVLANSRDFGAVMVKTLQRENMDAQYVLAAEIPSKLEEIAAADVVVSALGSPGLLKGGMFKDGAIVIDGGIEKVGEKIVGDVDFASTEGKNGFLAPVPGGVGPLTIACLLENVYLAFKAQQKE